MATAAPTTELEDLTTCAVCLETFTRPKVLPCQHSFCYGCLLLLGKDKSTITCPYCQEEHEIPASGVSGFKDSWILNNLVGMSLPKSEVCTDCKERPSVPDVCEHCGEKICHKCLVEHAKVSMEISKSLNQIRESFTISTSEDKMKKLKTCRMNLEDEGSRMTEMCRAEAVNKLIEVKNLLERAEFTENMTNIIGELYEVLGSEDKESRSSSYVSELLEKCGKCTTVDSLKYFKNNMADLKTLLRLIQTNNSDEEFKFRYNSTNREVGSDHLEFGQAVVNVRGKYLAENSVDQVTQFVHDSAETLGQQHVSPACLPHVDHMVSTCHPRVDHVSPACQPRVDHMVSPPTTDKTAHVETESEERFLELERDEKTLEDGDKKTSASATLMASCMDQQVVNNNSTSSSYPLSSSKVPKSGIEFRQNELPNQVNYYVRGETVVVGQGESVKKKSKLRSPQGCAYHVGRDEIFVADSGNRRIMAYGTDGKSARVFYQVVRVPRDVAVSSDGKNVYIAAETSIIKVNMEGRHVRTFNQFSLGHFVNCWSVICHGKFTVMLDDCLKYVVIINDRDEEVGCFGRKYMWFPRSVAVTDEVVYVAEHSSSCVNMFDWSGHQYLGTFAETNQDGDTAGIAVDRNGNVCISRWESHRIDVYSSKGKLITSIGAPGNAPGELCYPHGLCLTPDGRIIVVDYGNDRVQIF